MAWQAKIESYLNGLPFGAGLNSNTIRMAATETRAYTVLRTSDKQDGWKLYELDAFGKLAGSAIGSLFTGTSVSTDVCEGLVWDKEAGVMRVLFTGRNNFQILYQINLATGAAFNPQTVQSGSTRFSGLVKVGDALLTKRKLSRELWSIDLTDNAATVVSGKQLPAAAQNLDYSMDVDDEGQILMLPHTNDNTAATKTFRYNYTANTSAQLFTGTAATNYNTLRRTEGICVFGNNIILGELFNTTGGLGKTHLIRNSGLEIINSVAKAPDTKLGYTSSAVCKYDDQHIYYTDSGEKLYLVNLGDGTFTEVGTMFSSARTSSNRVRLMMRDKHTGEMLAWTSTAVYVVNRTTGTATLKVTLAQSNFSAHAISISTTHWRVWASNGDSREIVKATGAVGAIDPAFHGAPTNWGGITASDGTEYQTNFGDPNVYEGLGDPPDILLTVPALSAYNQYRRLFQINGTAYTFAQDSTLDATHLAKYKALFPEFYARGTIREPLVLPDPIDIILSTGYIANTRALPKAHGGKSPFTYTLQNFTNGTLSDTLPTGVTFNATTRVLSLAAGITAGDYAFVYKAVDSETPTRQASHAFLLRIGPAPTPGTTSGALTFPDQTFTATEGESTVKSSAAPTGGNPPYTYQAGTVTQESSSTPGSVNITPSSTNFPQEGWGSRGWGRRVDGTTFFGRIDNAAALDSNILAITNSYVIYKATTPSTKRPSVVIVDGTRYTASSHFAWSGTWGGRDNGQTAYKSVSLPSGNWNNVSVELADGTVTPMGGTTTQEVYNRNVFPYGLTFEESIKTFEISSGLAAGTYNLGIEATDTASTSVPSITVAAPNYGEEDVEGLFGWGLRDLSGRFIPGQNAFGSTSVDFPGHVIAVTDTEVVFTDQSNGFEYTKIRINGVEQNLLRGSSIFLGTGSAWRKALTSPQTWTNGQTVNIQLFNNSDQAWIPASGMRPATSARSDVTLTVAPRVVTPPITPPSISNVTVYKDQTLNQVLTEATGGKTPLTYSLEQQDGGSISGVAGIGFIASSRTLEIDSSTTVAGTYTLRMKIVDTASPQQVAYSNFSVVVLAGNTPTLAQGDVSVAQSGSAVLNAAGSGQGSFTYTLTEQGQTTLPAGITFNASTRTVLIARSASLGAKNLTLTAADSHSSVSVNFVLTVTRFIDMLALPVVNDVNHTRSATDTTVTLPAATGGVPPITYAADISNNDDGDITFNATTRVLTVAAGAAVGTYAVEYEAADSARTAIRNFNVIVTAAPALTLPTPNNMNAVGGVQVSQTLPKATGGRGNITYSVTTPDAVNQNLIFTPSTRSFVVNTATPTGVYTVTYTATDLDGPVSKTFTVTVYADLVLPSIPAVRLAQGQARDLQLPAATGGKPPYTYTLNIRADAQAAGMTYNQGTRTLVIPDTAPPNNYIFTYTVTDAAPSSQTATKNFRVVIAETSLVLPDVPTINIEDGDAVREITLPEASGGTAPYTYTVSDLPEGITIKPGTTRTLRVSSGVTPNTYTARYTARDTDRHTVTVDIPITREAHTPPAVGPTPFVLPDPPDEVNVLQGHRYVLPQPSGGVAPYHLILEQAGVGGLPAGISFNADTHTIQVGEDVRATGYPMLYSGYDSHPKANYILKDFTLIVGATPQIQHRDFDVLLHGTDEGVELPTATGGIGAFTYIATLANGAPLPEFATYDGRTITIKSDTESQTLEILWQATDTQHNTVSAIQTLNIRNTVLEEGRVIDPDTYADEDKIRFDFSETDDQPTHYVPAHHKWSITLPQATGGKGELRYQYKHPFTRVGNTLSGDNLDPGKHTITIRAIDENLAQFEIAYNIVIVEDSEIIEAAGLRTFEHQTTYSLDQPHYVGDLDVVVAAYHEDGSEASYNHYHPADGGAFIYRNPTGILMISLADEVRERLVQLSLTEPRSYAMLHFVTPHKPLLSEGSFPERNAPTQSISNELLRLDLQDNFVELERGAANQIGHGKMFTDGTITLAMFATFPTITTEYLAPKAVQTEDIPNGSIKTDKLSTEVQNHTVEGYEMFDIPVTNEVPVGTRVGIRHEGDGYIADPSLPYVGIMRTRTTVARTKGAVVFVDGKPRRV